MNKPRLTGGIDTRLWCISFVGMVAVMAESNSIVCGVIAFAVLWSLSRRLTANDPKACVIYMKAARLASVYDGSLLGSSR
jgi:type IV secretory pathway TrbD component